jgi:hypothetical protein
VNKVTITAKFLIARIEEELATLNDRRVIAQIRGLMVAPALQMRAWDYGAAGDAHLCWLVLAQKSQNTGIAYCESGFGPRTPWGLLSLEGTEHMSMGMDSGWFDGFLDAYFESPASSELPIWRVFRHDGNDFPGAPITEEDSWEATWAKVMRLRSEQPDVRFNCWQSVYVRGE